LVGPRKRADFGCPGDDTERAGALAFATAAVPSYRDHAQDRDWGPFLEGAGRSARRTACGPGTNPLLGMAAGDPASAVTTASQIQASGLGGFVVRHRVLRRVAKAASS